MELSAEEMLHAENFGLRLIQEDHFHEDLKYVKDKKNISQKSNILLLTYVVRKRLTLDTRSVTTC